MIEELRKINEKIIETDEENREKHIIIREILKDDNCFLKLDIDYAFSILRDLKIEEKNLKDTYSCLIDFNKKENKNKV